MRSPALGMVLMVLVGVAPLSVYGYGTAGKRFFPATLAVVDPFFIDELDLLLRHRPDTRRGSAQVDTTDAALKYSKRITDRLTVSLGSGYTHLNPAQGSTRNG
ncbi:MAG: hypothetical protein L0H63_14035, partial [Nitrococcus sp.]|nr:hypothetical protein [Nitrococcus sp.]